MMIGTYRLPIVLLLLTLLTCGLYCFYFMYVVTEEVNRYTGRNEQSPMGDVVLTIITCGLWDVFWDYKIGKRMADMTRACMPCCSSASCSASPFMTVASIPI